MAWMIRAVACPRCGHEGRADALRPGTPRTRLASVGLYYP